MSYFLFSKNDDMFERKEKILDFTRDMSDDNLTILFVVIWCFEKGCFDINVTRNNDIVHQVIYLLQQNGVATRLVNHIRKNDIFKKKAIVYADYIYQRYCDIFDSCHNCQHNNKCITFEKYKKSSTSLERKCSKYEKNIELSRGM